MKALQTEQIRELFIQFFADRGHKVIRSHALIPPDDPTLYFVNAGMVQFKDIFVGARETDYTRATTSQKCLRVSGKHNDLENVGRTARHHTFFEMLGNFSFGDYFKKDAITYAWDFVTKELKLPLELLYVTHHPDDDEARALWLEHTSVPEDRLLKDPENFWSMGDTGPCGPCSEIFVDLGPDMSGGKEIPFGHPEGDDRYIEIWNLVFMQFDRAADGTMSPLPKPSIDTGAGLERLAMVLQGTPSNYETDAFMPIIENMSKRSGVPYGDGGEQDVAFRVIADHSRAAAFLIADGIYPDNEGRGYVLRRIMRRAIRFGRLLGVTDPFLVHTTAQVVEMMGRFYPELTHGADTIKRIVLQEEERFGRTINNGLKRLDEALGKRKENESSPLDGRIAFELYDTYGFPPDLTRLICEERGVSVDDAGFEIAMQEQRERARAASKFGTQDMSAYQALVEAGVKTTFTGYEGPHGKSNVLALLSEGARVPRAAAGARVEIVMGETPFYPEGGGQVGDTGTLQIADGTRVSIEDTQKPFGDLIVHLGVVAEGTLEEGAQVISEVDDVALSATRKNHSATHLLHLALREILGEHVRQRGSLVGPDRLRFDFSHTSGMTPEEIRRVEDRVNALILNNEAVQDHHLPMDEAIARGAIAFFEEKYGDKVRMLCVGSESTELCGGHHVSRTGDIGLFKILSEAAISSGVRRVEATTGLNALHWVQRTDDTLRSAADTLRVGTHEVVTRIGKLLQERKALSQSVEALTTRVRTADAQASLARAVEVGGFKVADVRLDDVGGKELRQVAERLRDQLGGPGAVLIVGAAGAKVSLIVAVTKEAAAKFPAGKAVGSLAPLVGGRGGGRPDLAQAGGSDAAGIDAVIREYHVLAEQAFSA